MRKINMQRRVRSVAVMAGVCLVGACLVLVADEWKSGIEWKKPEIVTPGAQGGAPSDAIVLFDGTNMDAWTGGEGWTLENGYGISGSRVTTRQAFGDCQLHLEFATPGKVEGEGQGRGNNGVFLMGHYELQILDSYENETYYDGQCGSIYKQHPPLVNASLPPGEWQTYDVVFTAPRFHADGTLKSPATITAFQNGVLIQNHFELLGGTFWDAPPSYKAHNVREPLTLYYHKNPVRFRNIWIRDLMPQAEPAARK
jgi:hypothetical protein